MISAGHSAHTIADNSQGICLKHRDNGAGNPLSAMAVVDRLYVNSTTHPLPSRLVQCFVLDPKRLCTGRINVVSIGDQKDVIINPRS